MNLRTVILAFLSARYPAAYAEPAVLARINRCGLLDDPATAAQVNAELITLAGPKFHYVDIVPDHTTGDAYWSATDAGVRQWNLDGRILVK